MAELKLENARLSEDNKQLCGQIQSVMLDVARSKREVSDAQLAATAHQQQANDAR